MNHVSTERTLQDLIEGTPDLVDHFFNETSAPHFSKSPQSVLHIPAEFTNWREEQRAWRESAVLMDQSHHMLELYLSGPDALRLLERVGINSFAGFSTDRAKQLVGCAPSGHVIGDCVVYHLEEGVYELISGTPLLNWVRFQAETGGFDVTIERDEPTLTNTTGRRRRYRYQLDGPAANDILSDAVEGDLPDIPFFRTARVRIAGREVLVLRHGMAGHKGAEISGDWDDRDTVRQAILDAGEPYGVKRGGTKAYFSTLFESGWMSYPVPAIFTGEELRPFREWLPANGWEGSQSLGGSCKADDISAYYVTPYELGYGRIVRFDHDFIGRESLEAMDPDGQRRKVTLVWDHDDVARVFAAQLGDGPRYKAIELPNASFGWPHADAVTAPDGTPAGISFHCGYSANEREVLSLAVLAPEFAVPGTEVVLVWGEAGGGSRKPGIERHETTTIRALVAEAPYASAVQRMKREKLGSR